MGLGKEIRKNLNIVALLKKVRKNRRWIMPSSRLELTVLKYKPLRKRMLEDRGDIGSGTVQLEPNP